MLTVLIFKCESLAGRCWEVPVRHTFFVMWKIIEKSVCRIMQTEMTQEVHIGKELISLPGYFMGALYWQIGRTYLSLWESFSLSFLHLLIEVVFRIKF